LHESVSCQSNEGEGIKTTICGHGEREREREREIERERERERRLSGRERFWYRIAQGASQVTRVS